MTVVIEILDINFEVPSTNAFQVTFRDFVTTFRHDLKRSLDSEFVVDIHQGGTEIPASRCLYIVRHNGATCSAVRPEPDEWNLGLLASLKGQEQQALHDVVHSLVDWPMWKAEVSPSVQSKFLQVLPQCHRQYWTKKI